MSPLLRIKRCCLSGRVVFTDKADTERVVNAPAVYKTLRSRALVKQRRNEKLYVVIGITHEGILVYTKGALRNLEGEEVFYLLVSAKRSIEP
ncbi:MAG: hypothetical protein IT375_33515 [Polyangiaceae bacterium]|nr:hypothetical protein [Polyangiaceae bacterium]